MYRRSDVVKPETMPEYGTFKATETERVPSAYYVPATLTRAIENLRAHGIVMTPLKTAQTVQVEQFTHPEQQAVGNAPSRATTSGR